MLGRLWREGLVYQWWRACETLKTGQKETRTLGCQALDGRLSRGGEVRAPDSALAADELAGVDAVYGVCGQFACG